MKNIFTFKYFELNFGMCLEFLLHKGSANSSLYMISIGLGFIQIKFNLPYRTNLKLHDSMPKTGLTINKGVLYFYYSSQVIEFIDVRLTTEKFAEWKLPIFYLKLETRTKYLEPIFFPFKYTLKDGTSQEVIAKCFLVLEIYERKWTLFFHKNVIYLSIEFYDVTESDTSAVNGIGGTVEEKRKNESVEQCIRRIERTRRF